MVHYLKNLLSIILGLTLIILSNINGHFNPPFSIEATPFLITLTIALINYPLYNANFTLTVFYNFGLLLFNDVFIRSYAGGAHDNEGKGWICLFSTIAFIVAVISMLGYAFSDKRKDSLKTNIVTIMLSAIATTLIYFSSIADM